MANSDLISLSTDGGNSIALSPEERRRKLTAISARVGVWGIIGGLGSVLLAPLSPGLALNLLGLGFLAGGAGAIGTSILVTKDLKRASLPLKLATFVGFPFGASLAIFGASQLFRLSGLPKLVAYLVSYLVAYSIPVGALLGLTLMILLLAGFFSHAFFNKDPDLDREIDWED